MRRERRKKELEPQLDLQRKQTKAVKKQVSRHVRHGPWRTHINTRCQIAQWVEHQIDPKIGLQNLVQAKCWWGQILSNQHELCIFIVELLKCIAEQWLVVMLVLKWAEKNTGHSPNLNLQLVVVSTTLSGYAEKQNVYSCPDRRLILSVIRVVSMIQHLPLSPRLRISSRPRLLGSTH